MRYKLIVFYPQVLVVFPLINPRTVPCLASHRVMSAASSVTRVMRSRVHEEEEDALVRQRIQTSMYAPCLETGCLTALCLTAQVSSSKSWFDLMSLLKGNINLFLRYQRKFEVVTLEESVIEIHNLRCF